MKKMKNTDKETKKVMIKRLLFNLLEHPSRGYDLIKNVKKGHLHFGDHHTDICYLKYGKIVIPKEDKPVVSIIIPVYNQLIFTYKCLISIMKYTKDVPYEIIIGDDLSNDGTRFLDSYTQNVNIIRNEKNLRFLRNCNNAAKKARGQYILFLNNDTEVTENWLSSLVDLIEKDKTIGMVGSKLIFPDGRLQEAGGIIFNDGSAWNYGKYDDSEKPQYNYVRDADYISGASIMLSKKLWDEIGGFDDDFAPAYCEDSDLAFAVRKKGLRVVYQPKSVVIHYEGVSNGINVNNTNSLKHYQVLNTKRLKEKWADDLINQPELNPNMLNFSFRDHLTNKKVVLFVDHFVPEYDKDAGSKTTFQYLKMLVSKGYLVKFLPDNFYHSKPYTEVLEQLGIEVLYGIDYRNNFEEWLLQNKDNIDVAYLNRPHISVKYIDFIREKTNIKIIYYGHDLHFLREKREYEITKNSQNLVNSDYWKDIELNIMKKSDVVYYPSYIEKELINSIDKKINVKAINAYIFDNIDTKTNINFKNKEGLLFVGGFNHRPNVDAVLWFVKEVYPQIRKKQNVPFYIVGSNAPIEILELNNIDGVIVKGYVTEDELNYLYKECKLVVVPLRYGAGIKGKVVEAMSKGNPMVTTSVGAEGIIGIEKILPIIDKPNEFANKILELYNDDAKLSKISLEERNYINKNFSTAAAWNIIEKDFNKKFKYIIITPDGYGSKGDEAMIRGALNLIGQDSAKIITQRKDLWTNHLNFSKNRIEEEYVELSNFKNAVNKEKKMIIIGADLIDGTQGLESSISRLEAAQKIAKNGGIANIYCSFRSDVDEEIIKLIKSLPSTVKFYLRDEISYRNFINLTRKECKYFPDLGFVINQKENTNIKLLDKLKSLKITNNLIGLNFSETSFRSLYKDYSLENRQKYVEEVIKTIIKTVENPYIVLICHDIRGWDNYKSDDDYNNIAVEICKKINFNNIIRLDKDINHLEIISILKELETVITGRMHLSIAGFKAGIIPIVYTGSGKQKFSMHDKMHGMFLNRINDDSFVTHDLTKLELALKKIVYNYFDCLELLEYEKKVFAKDLDNIQEMKKILDERDKNDNN